MAGYNGGYGLFVKLRTQPTSAPAYGHMSRLGPGIKPGVVGAPGPGDRLRRLDRHVDRPAPALRVPSRRQAGQSAGPEVRHARDGSAARTSRASRGWPASICAAQERAGGARQARGMDETPTAKVRRQAPDGKVERSPTIAARSASSRRSAPTRRSRQASPRFLTMAPRPSPRCSTRRRRPCTVILVYEEPAAAHPPHSPRSPPPARESEAGHTAGRHRQLNKKGPLEAALSFRLQRFIGGFAHHALAADGELAVLDADLDGLAVLDAALEDQRRQRVLQLRWITRFSGRAP